MSSISDPSSYAPVMLRWDTGRGTSCKAHWYITLTLSPKPSDNITQSNYMQLCTNIKNWWAWKKKCCPQTFQRHLQKDTTQDFRVLLAFISLCSSFGQISKLLKATRQLVYAKKGKRALKMSLERKTFFIWSFSLSCKVSFLLCF